VMFVLVYVCVCESVSVHHTSCVCVRACVTPCRGAVDRKCVCACMVDM